MRKPVAAAFAATMILALVSTALPAAGLTEDEVLFTGDVLSASWEGVEADRYYRLHVFAREGWFCDPAAERCKRRGSGSSDQMIQVANLEIWGVDAATGEPNWEWYRTLGGQALASDGGSAITYDSETGRIHAEGIELTGFDDAGNALNGTFSVNGIVTETCDGKGRHKQCKLLFNGTHPTVTGSVEVSFGGLADFHLGGVLFSEKHSPVAV
jgi:hypothetical protein